MRPFMHPSQIAGAKTKVSLSEYAGAFSELTSAASRDFDEMKFKVGYPKGAILFVEGQQPQGVFCLCKGEAKLSINSSEGKRLIIRLAGAGEILGLMAALSGSPYEVTAETVYPCEAAFVRCDAFLRFIRKYPEVSEMVAKQVNLQYQATCQQLRTLSLSTSVHRRLANLLLSWPASIKENKDGATVILPLTHEEMAEFIGAARETVTRVLSEFRHRHLVELRGSRLTIPSRTALETFVGA